MKATVLAAAALLGGASAQHNHHAHQVFHKRQNADSGVVCSVVTETFTGTDFIWTPTPDAQPANPVDSTTTTYSTTTRTTTLSEAVTVPAATSSAQAVPTPAEQTLTTPGTYTFPASTVILTNTTSAAVPSITAVTAGTHTLGGVVTVVETATTVVCPYATASTNSAGVVTNIITSTEYVCPSAGTYTIAPITTTVTQNETVTVPVITTYPPGTYTAPAVTTVIETATVVYCPFSSAEASTTAASSSSSTSAAPVVVPTPEATSSVPVVVSTPEATSSAPVVVPTPEPTSEAPVVSTTPVVVPSSTSTSEYTAATSEASTHRTSTTTGALGQWALTYTPYNKDTGNCQTAEQVNTDLLAISLAGFSTIRIYSTDCDTLTNVGAAAATYGLRLIPGIYVSASGCSIDSADIAEQVSDYLAWTHWDLVEFLAVGNEALANSYCSGAQLAALITGVKSALGSVYTGAYTTTDVVSAWQVEEAAAAVCAVVDFPSANVHSYFTSTVAPEDAGTFVQGQLEIVEAMCGGKGNGYVLESGYPTAGSTIGLNVPSVANQAIAVASILEAVGSKTVMFSMYDDLWKSPGAYNCEQHWGIVPSLFGAVAESWDVLASLA